MKANVNVAGGKDKKKAIIAKYLVVWEVKPWELKKLLRQGKVDFCNKMEAL